MLKVKVTGSKNASNGDFIEIWILNGTFEERDGLVDGPAKEMAEEYDWEASDEGCTQSVCSFIIIMAQIYILILKRNLELKLLKVRDR